MKLSEVLLHLSTGELSQLGLVDQTTLTIPPAKWPGIINSINLGLTDIYRTLPLKEGREPVALMSNTEEYVLVAADLAKVIEVYTDLDEPLPLNDGSAYAITTPSMRKLKVPKDIVNRADHLPEQFKTSSLTVVYQALHPMISPAVSNPSSVELELPQTHLQALLLFVASRVHNPIGMTNEFNSGNNYAAKYFNEIQSLKNDGQQLDASIEDIRFSQRGWV